MTKSVFIRALMNAGIAGKTERALYQNLEFLEKKKLVSYDNKVLQLTDRGRKRFEKIVDEVSPYLAVLRVLRAYRIIKCHILYSGIYPLML